MEIPLTLFGVLIAGLMGAYITMLYRAFQFSKDVETDLSITVQNLKIRELGKIEDFLKVESSEFSSHGFVLTPEQKAAVQEKIKKVMEERWSNAYSCYQAEELADKLDKQESSGQLLCIVGVMCVLVSFIIYIRLLTKPNMLGMWIILALCFLPLIAIAWLFFSNVIIRRKIRNLKKGLEKIWQF